MTPLAYIKIAIFVVVFALGSAFGYGISNHFAQADKKIIAHDVDIGKIQDKTHDQLVADLRAQNAQLQKAWDTERAASQAAKQASDTQWKQTVAQKDAALDAATKNSVKAQVQVNSLKSALFLATSPEEKQALQKQLDDAQKQVTELREREDGLKCLSVPIPKEYLDAANSSLEATK